MPREIPGLRLTVTDDAQEASGAGIFVGGTVLAIVVGAAYGVWRVPFEPRDNQHYFFIAEEFARGIPPHLSAFDPKHMLGSMLMGSLIFLGDQLGVSVVWSARAASLLLSGVTAGLAGLIALRLTGRRMAGWFAVLTSVAWSSVMYQSAVGGQPKHVVMLCVALCLYAVATRHMVVAAFCGGLAFLAWQPTLLMLGILGVVTLARPDRWSLAWRQAIAAAIPVALYEAYFWRVGALGEEVEQAYRFPSRYMTHTVDHVGVLLRSVRTVWQIGYGRWNPAPWIGVAFGVAILVGLARRRVSPLAWMRDETAWAYFLLTGAAVTAFTIYDHQGPPDFWLVLVHLAVAVAISLTAVVERASHPATRRVALAATTSLLVGLAVYAYRIRPQLPVTIADQVAAAGEVRSMVDRGETVYAVNAAYLLGLARVSNWSPFSSFFRGVNRYLPVRSGNRAAWVPAHDGRLPSEILVGKGVPYGWPGWLMAHYEQGASSTAMQRSHVEVWRRRKGDAP